MNKETKDFPLSQFPVTCHTDFVGQNTTFFAFNGATFNGITFIPQALQKGAKKIVISDANQITNELVLAIQNAGATLVIESDNQIRSLFAQECANASGNAAQKLKIIGITGTKGKSTTTFLTAHILAQTGHKVAFISTAGNNIDGTSYPGMLTTPQADYLHQFFALCLEKKIEYVVLEISAQALSLQRVAGIPLSAGIITNLYPDHSEFYPKVEDYFGAKMMILEMLKKSAPLIFNTKNKLLLWAYKNRYLWLNYKPVSLDTPTSFLYAKTNKEKPEKYTLFYQKTKAFKEKYTFSCPVLFGTYNGENCIAALGTTTALGINIQDACTAISTFRGVPGRWQEHILANGARAIIDYAHNPLSFYTVLSTMKQLTNDLIVVFGAGGERSKENRPQMGRISCALAQKVILTTDNPRSEDPHAIIQDIMSFCEQPLTNTPQEKEALSTAKEHIYVELDRKAAIKMAYELSRPNSIIAILGKGPDEYQIVGKEKTFFSDTSCLKEFLSPPHTL